ncbi:hypothetical protein HYN49_13665 [Flavobacterium pallidum]|uniref:Uncharacterized protein n=1 Tax=Flavobacterium pallidum TaxID=2172098 RepID=A0A2S1SKB4_9FLAO|nr:hypothetical protein HYN49_13665 [Flavobacterium pallidum]
MIYFDPYKSKTTGLEYYLIFILSVFGIYSIYKKATEKNLTEIVGSADITYNKELLMKYCAKRGFDLYRDSKKLIIYNSNHTFGFGSDNNTSRIIFFDKDKLLVTVIKDGFRANPPILFSDTLFKREIKNLFKITGSS